MTKADHIALEIGEVLARNTLALISCGLPPPAPGKERSNVDILRVQAGKVAEYWDRREDEPRKTTTAALTTA